MKNDLFSIGKFVIHGYGLMIALGFFFCVLLAMHRAKKRALSADAVIDVALYGIIAGFLGAKLLYLIVEWKELFSDPLAVLGSEGFVVYGGVIAGVLCGYFYCRRKKLSFLAYFDLAAPSIALAQGFGRIGCFLAGCCYGKETTGWFGVVFPAGSMAPSGVRLIPTQLLSSAGDFVILAALLFYAGRERKKGTVGALYMILYGIGRFVVEFFRGDERGGIGMLSTSQLISLVIVAGGTALFLRDRFFQEKSKLIQEPEQGANQKVAQEMDAEPEPKKEE